MTTRRFFLLFFLFLLFLLLRLPYLTADPPPVFSIDFFGDEGCWVHNVRNKVLFGSWLLDDINMAYLISPTYCFTLYLFLKIFGSGILQARLVSVVPGALAPIFFYLLLRRFWDVRPSLWGALLLGSNFFLLCFNRIALVDSLLLTTLLCAFWLWLIGERRPLCMIPAGAVFALASLVKVSALFVAPAFLFLILSRRRDERISPKRQAKEILFFCLSFTVVWASYWIFIVQPHLANWMILKGKFVKHNFPSHPFQFIPNFFIYITSVHKHGVAYKHFWLWMPVTIFLGWLYLMDLSLRMLEGWKTLWRELSRIEMMALAWLLSYFIILGPMTYKPDRRFVLFLPPLIILVVKFLYQNRAFSPAALSRGIFSKNSGKHLRRTLLMLCTLSLPFIYLGPLFADLMYPWLVKMDRALELGAKAGTVGFIAMSLCFLIFFLFLIFALYLLRKILLKLPALSLPFHPSFVLILVFNLGIYAYFLMNPSFTIYNASRYLNRIFTVDTVVMGEPSDTLSLETQAFSFFTAGKTEGMILNDHAMERFSPDYYIMMIYENNPLFNRPVGISGDRLKLMEEIPLLPDLQGQPRLNAGLFRVIK